MADENKEEEKFSGIIPAVLSGLASIGGMIPSLLKGPQERALKRAQAGQGAGAVVARQTGSEAARRVLGASAAQPSSGRGGNLREGIRAADQLTQRGAAVAARIGAQEGLEATRMLQANQLARRDAGRLFGAGIGQNLAGVGAMLAAARDQGRQVEQEKEAGDILRAASPQNEITGLYGSPEFSLPSQQLALPSIPEIEPIDEIGLRSAQRPGVQGPQVTSPGGPSRPLQEPMQRLPVEPGYGPPQEQASPAQTQQQQMKRRVQGMADVTARKQDAGAIYQATSVGAPVSPSMTDPFQTQQHIYNEVMNYNPATNQGMSPQEAEYLLMLMGFPVDYSRLVSDAVPESFGTMFKGAGQKPSK